MPGTTANTGQPAAQHSRAPYEALVHQQLLQWGVSVPGVQQLEQGRMPGDAPDRRLVTAIVAQAARDGVMQQATLPLQSAHETLARAWVLWRLGLCSEAGRVAARLARSLPVTRAGDDDETDALLIAGVDILRAAGRHSLADELIQSRMDPSCEGRTSAAQQA